MQIQDLSYTLNNSFIKVEDEKNLLSFEASVEIFSLENNYTIKDGTLIKNENNYYSNEIIWGDSEHITGSANIKITASSHGKRFLLSSSLDRPVRAMKLRLDHLPLGKLISLISEDKEVTERGLLYRYPEGWRSLSTPLLIFKIEEKKYLYIRCLDNMVRAKHFFIMKQGDSMRVDIVQEQDGQYIDNSFTAPEIEYGITTSAEEIICEHSDFIKSVYHLDEYKDNKNVPVWMKDISLVITMHMEHFTGHIFHTYHNALEDVKKITSLLEGKHIIVYLAGWEGRYYYKYGNYTPDDRLGGEKGLKELVDGLHKLGCKVMAMYGMNIANKNIPSVNKIYQECEFQSVSGAKFHHGSVDWEGAHHYDFNELVQLNIANKLWQDYLFDQIKNATDKFDFDGAFLDIAACYVNDKNHSLYEGVVKFCNRLRDIKPDFLVSGEGFYDGLAKAIPLFQSGHTDGWMHYHDRVSPLLFTRFAREFSHLCLGDPAFHSTGVHEQGHNIEIMAPLREGIIPTLSLINGSVKYGWDNIEKIINQALEYKRKYLNEND